MKNKKLFAIITMVAFMLTLMPIMAFGAATSTGSWIELDRHAVALDTELKGNIHLDGVLDDQTIIVVAMNEDGIINRNVTVKVDTDDKKGFDTTANAVTSFTVKSDKVTSATVKVFLADGVDITDTTTFFALEQMINKGYVIKDGKEVGYIKEIAADGSMKVTFGSATGAITMDGIFTPVINGTSGTDVTVTDMKGTTTVIPDVETVSANNGIDVYNVRLILSTDTGKLANTSVNVSFDKVGAYINETELVTNAGGVVSFKVYANKGNTYIMNVAANNFSQNIKLAFSDIAAAKAEFVNITTDTIAAGESTGVIIATVKAVDSLGNSVAYSNSNLDIEVISAPELSSLKGVKESTSGDEFKVVDGKTLYFCPDVSGAYTLKVYNKTTGISNSMAINAAKFGAIDHITIAYPSNSYALGETTGTATVKGYDKDGIVKTLMTGNDFSYTGVGVAKFNADNKGTIQFLSNAAYAGQQVVVTVVHQNKFMATTTLTIGVQPATINFAEGAGAAGTEVTVTGQLVDLNGNAIAPSANATITNNAVIVTKPEGALTYADTEDYDANAAFTKEGIFTLKVTSNKEGIVKVNVITNIDPSSAANDDYYVAGTATINFGNVPVVETHVESVINMIIGANTVIADGKATTAPVAPFIENGRTFVPVRAFAEATGATVNYDAVTRVITIKAKGVNAQMTIDSNVMVVNDKTITMDTVAQVVGDGYTVLPIRYAGQALGYDFTLTYDDNGAVTAVTMTK